MDGVSGPSVGGDGGGSVSGTHRRSWQLLGDGYVDPSSCVFWMVTEVGCVGDEEGWVAGDEDGRG